MPGPGPEADDSSSSEDEDGGAGRGGGRNSRSNRMNRRTTAGRKKDPNSDEEMQDAVPDVKAVSSSTDSSRLSHTAAKHS